MSEYVAGVGWDIPTVVKWSDLLETVRATDRLASKLAIEVVKLRG